MYERFYGLRERPFSLTPDPSYLYPSRVHREALSHLRYGIEGHAGFIVVTGEIGCGKTTMLQTVLRALDKKTSIARLMNTMLDARELLQAIMLDFGLEPRPDATKPYLVRELARFLVDQRNNGRLSLLVIDEAQNLSVAQLEELRVLSNLNQGRQMLLQAILVGQPELRAKLGGAPLRQFAQRIVADYHIGTLHAGETLDYVRHRLQVAGGAADLFTPEAVCRVYEAAGGTPRLINILCDHALLYGFTEQCARIDVEIVAEVLRDRAGGVLPLRGVEGIEGRPSTPPAAEPAWAG